MRRHRHLAMSLVELLVCLAIGAVTLSIAAPGLAHMMKRSEATTTLNWLVGNVVFARHSAVAYGVMVTLCPSTDGQSCGGAWHDGTIVFTDIDGDRQIDDRDKVLKRFQSPADGASVYWRSFGNRQYLQLTSRGYTNWQNGNFVYCPADGDLRYARQLVINLQGRARTSKDVDGDGFVEDRRGKHLRC